jgi:osmotically-inducible protein OsmY
MKLTVIVAVLLFAGGPTAGAAFAQSAAASQAKPNDQELSRAIATKIAGDKSLSPDAVKVTVEGGVVTLTGIVANNADIARVGQLARVPGVTRVENKLTSREKVAGAVKDAAGVSTSTNTQSASAKPSDTDLSKAIASKIADDKSLTPDAVKVTVEGGVATLTGIVATNADITRIGQLARVPGVARVENKLTSREKVANTAKDAVGVGTDTAARGDAKPSDADLSKAIATRIAEDKTLTPDAVKVTVERGVATLTGMVATEAEIAKFGQLARVPGVARVDNKLTSREKTLGTVR